MKTIVLVALLCYSFNDAKRLIAAGYSIEEAADFTGLPIEEAAERL